MLSNMTAQWFHLLVCLFKLLYFLSLLDYLFVYSDDTHNLYGLPEFDRMIKIHGMHNLMIAALIGLALECIGILGATTKIGLFNLIYLLAHISVVPFYLHHSKFQNLWLLYEISLFSSIIFIHKLNVR